MKPNVSLLFAIPALLLTAPLVKAQELWKEPQDTVAALTNSDHYAWRLFIALNWPADVANRQADKNRQFGENATTVWESWKLSSGNNNEVFLRGGADPGLWPGKVRNLENKENDFTPSPFQQLRRFADPKKRRMFPRFDPNISQSGNENHMNQKAYEFIVENDLYERWGRGSSRVPGGNAREFRLEVIDGWNEGGREVDLQVI